MAMDMATRDDGRDSFQEPTYSVTDHGSVLHVKPISPTDPWAIFGRLAEYRCWHSGRDTLRSQCWRTKKITVELIHE